MPPLPTLSRSTLLTLAVTLTVLVSLAAVLLFDRSNAHTSVFTLSNFVGPTAFTLRHAAGLTVCSVGMGTLGNPICYHAARMPVASAVVALGDLFFGDRYLPIGLFKALLLLLPLEAAILLATRRLPRTAARRWLTLALLLLPFGLTPFLADVVNLQVEEGYSYSLLALSFALVLFPREPDAGPASHTPGRTSSPTRTWPACLLFAITVAALYLTKSSMAPAVAVLTLCFLWPVRKHPARIALTLVLILAAPAGWAAWQHHSSGRYTFGTSLDGANLHKGNNPDFLARYPPPPGGHTLDEFDPAMNHGLYFPNEWAFNDFHQRAAAAYIRSHPAATVQADIRKLDIVLLTLHKVGSQPGRGALELLETAGILVGRLLLWSALLLALLHLVRGPARAPAVAFLLLVAAVSLPYVIGFAYTRHVSVLLYPAALLLCRLLAPPPVRTA